MSGRAGSLILHSLLAQSMSSAKDFSSSPSSQVEPEDGGAGAFTKSGIRDGDRRGTDQTPTQQMWSCGRAGSSSTIQACSAPAEKLGRSTFGRVDPGRATRTRPGPGRTGAGSTRSRAGRSSERSEPGRCGPICGVGRPTFGRVNPGRAGLNRAGSESTWRRVDPLTL